MTRMLSILYVDDEPNLLEIGRLFLEQSGEYSIDTSVSAADALLRLEQKKYDAIVSDYQMPEMDGIQFLQLLRKRGDPIPFIIFTGRGREEVILEALNSGVDFYLQKGGDPEAQFAELQNIVGKAVRQKSADEALRESEAKYRNILENIQDVYYRSDADGNLVLASPSIATVLGYDTFSQLYGKNIAQTLYYNPDQRKQFLADINKTGSVTNYEVILKKRDGTPVFVLTSSHKYYDQSGNFLGVEGIFRDINDIKQAGNILALKVEELARSNTELEQFAHIASHDLQQPLRRIASYLQLIEQRYKGRLDSDADEFIGYAVDGAKELQIMINGLLDFSHVQTLAISFEKTDCEILLKDAMSQARIAIQESGATITHDPLPVVRGDARQIIRIFQNLINNAIKFRGKEPPAIHISAEQKDGSWIFSVRDNGIGFDPEYKDKLFILFQRLHGKDLSGTGVGLAVCKRIVERHGGKVWADSKPGAGSIFFFSIPVEEGSLND